MTGKTLGHFRVVGKLGEGGMGEVYRATATKLGRDVAVKVLPAQLAHVSGAPAASIRKARKSTHPDGATAVSTAFTSEDSA